MDSDFGMSQDIFSAHDTDLYITGAFMGILHYEN